MQDFTDKIALVTGGSSGIGLATARELVSRGARVYITGRRAPELAAAAAASGAIGVQADVSSLADLDALYARIGREAGRLDVLFANAGGGGLSPLADVTPEHFDETFATNVRGTLFTVQKALPLLRDGAAIVLAGSTTTVKGTAGFSVYSASKAAIRNFARSWLLELAPRRIRVNVISPGPIGTPGLSGLVAPEHQAGLLAQLAANVPLNRLGEPTEIARAVAFLASDAASFVNGAELFADGGLAQV